MAGCASNLGVPFVVLHTQFCTHKRVCVCVCVCVTPCSTLVFLHLQQKCGGVLLIAHSIHIDLIPTVAAVLVALKIGLVFFLLWSQDFGLKIYRDSLAPSKINNVSGHRHQHMTRIEASRQWVPWQTPTAAFEHFWIWYGMHHADHCPRPGQPRCSVSLTSDSFAAVHLLGLSAGLRPSPDSISVGTTLHLSWQALTCCRSGKNSLLPYYSWHGRTGSWQSWPQGPLGRSSALHAYRTNPHTNNSSTVF